MCLHAADGTRSKVIETIDNIRLVINKLNSYETVKITHNVIKFMLQQSTHSNRMQLPNEIMIIEIMMIIGQMCN